MLERMAHLEERTGRLEKHFTERLEETGHWLKGDLGEWLSARLCRIRLDIEARDLKLTEHLATVDGAPGDGRGGGVSTAKQGERADAHGDEDLAEQIQEQIQDAHGHG